MLTYIYFYNVMPTKNIMSLISSESVYYTFNYFLALIYFYIFFQSPWCFTRFFWSCSRTVPRVPRPLAWRRRRMQRPKQQRRPSMARKTQQPGGNDPAAVWREKDVLIVALKRTCNIFTQHLKVGRLVFFFCFVLGWHPTRCEMLVQRV